MWVSIFSSQVKALEKPLAVDGCMTEFLWVFSRADDDSHGQQEPFGMPEYLAFSWPMGGRTGYKVVKWR